MARKQFKLSSGNPLESPFGDSLTYQLAVVLELSDGEPIRFADLETTRDEHHALQKEFWNFNVLHRELTWRFATRHFESPGGQFDVVRVWKVPKDLPATEEDETSES